MKSDIDDNSGTHASLLLRIRDSGDHRAWAEFEGRYGPMIRSWCRRWFPRETDDRVQDVYCKLVDRLRTFEYDPGQGRFRGWLKTVTNRLMSDLKQRAEREPGAGGAFLLDEVEARQDLDDRLAALYDLELLEKAKERVRCRCEARTWAAYTEAGERGRRPEEVAAELNLRVAAVYQAKHRVITELKREIEILEGPP